MNFQTRKAAVLQDLASSLPDKSSKGGVDERIAHLIARVNAHPAFFTTSSCSGRICISISRPDGEVGHVVEEGRHSLVSQEVQGNEAHDIYREGISRRNKDAKKNTKGGGWCFLTHDPADANEVVNTVMPSCGSRVQRKKHQDLVFRFEPFILAVECLNLSAAQALVSCAISSGFRESGITSIKRRIIVAVRSSIRLEVPITDGALLMVDEPYLRFLVHLANEKLELNHQKTDKFLSEFIGQVEVLCKPMEENVIGEHATGKHRRKTKCHGQNHARKFAELKNRQLHILSRILQLDDQINTHFSVLSKLDGLDVAKAANSEEIETISVVQEHNAMHSVDIKDVNNNCISNQPSLGKASEGFEMEGITGTGELFTRLRTSLEQLQRWGHSACRLPSLLGKSTSSVIVFGGYGCSFRQCRQSDVLILDCNDGKLETVLCGNPPTARLGHTASIVGHTMVVIGGREAPNRFLGDVCVLMLENMQWTYPNIRGDSFHSRHRHAAVAIGEKIYVFGGLGAQGVLGDLWVLDLSLLSWSRIHCLGNVPAPRHSHSLSTVDQNAYLFGGFDGNMVFGDLWVLHIESLSWHRICCSIIHRFSHSMTVYNRFLLLLGGCPLAKEANGTFLLNIDTMKWSHCKVKLLPDSMLVRHTATYVDGRVVILGGGVSCFAFGIKFSPPFVLDPLLLLQCMLKNEVIPRNNCLDGDDASLGVAWGVKISKSHAKCVKDNLQRLGWLNHRRKARVDEDGSHIIFPITSEAVQYFKAKITLGASCEADEVDNGEEFTGVIEMKIVEMPKSDDLTTTKNPRDILLSCIGSLIQREGLSSSLLLDVPKRWERLDDIIILPVDSFRSDAWKLIELQLWMTVANCLNVCRVARQAPVDAADTRDSNLVLLLGDNGWVHHRENGILYCFDATKCMFSSGNISERIRMARLNCHRETILDLFAGIGYFVLPFLKANAEKVYACEWNPHALYALRYNLCINKVEDCCVIIEGDNRNIVLEDVVDRVCLGLLPSSERSWEVAIRALRLKGGTLHVHGNVKDTEEHQWVDHVCRTITKISKNQGHNWEIQVIHVERVKWYAPHIRHVVVDLKCGMRLHDHVISAVMA